MSLLRKFFYRKPPEGLLEISERVFVFDCCFTSDVLEEDEYDFYMGGIVHNLYEHFPDASFMVFNFREEELQSQIESILKEYDMTVINYPQHYENCPVLTMEMIHHFLKSSESWLSLGPPNVLLLHCELGGWPVLAFMLAALLIFRKQYSGERKTLDMIYKQAPRELLELMLPLNPLPSQLRYLQYVSRRNLGSEWPPLDRALTLDCIILRNIPDMDGEGGCRPIFRIYGQDPFMAADRTPKILFSTPKNCNAVRRYKEGDVVLECITLDDELEGEEMMFRVVFNTAFIRSNILILNRDDIDILWDVKDQFPKHFRSEILFSEMDSASSVVTPTLPYIDDKGGLPCEAFSKVRDIFSNVDWLDPRTDVALDILEIRAANIIQEKLETLSPRPVRTMTDKLMKSASSLANEVIDNFMCETPTSEDFETSFLQLARKLNVGGSSFQDAIEGMNGINIQRSVSKNKLESVASNLGKTYQERVASKPNSKELDNESEAFSPPSLDQTMAALSSALYSKLMDNDEPSKSSKLDNLAPEQSLERVTDKPNSRELDHKSEASSLPSLDQTIATFTSALHSRLRHNNGETSNLSKLDNGNSTSHLAPEQSMTRNDTKPQDQQIAQPEVTTQNESSSTRSVCNFSHASKSPLSRYHGGSTVGITALLQDQADSNMKESTSSVTMSPRHTILASVSSLVKPLMPLKSLLSPQSSPSSQFPLASVSPISTPLSSLIQPSPPPPPPPPPSTDGERSAIGYDPPCAPSSSSGVESESTRAANSTPCPPPRPPSLLRSVPVSVSNVMSGQPPPPPPPPPSTDGERSAIGYDPPCAPSSSSGVESDSTRAANSTPCPPPRPPSLSRSVPVSVSNRTSGQPPPPPLLSRSVSVSVSAPLPPCPPSLRSNSTRMSSSPPPPPPPKGSTNGPPVPPPPAPFNNGNGGSAGGGGSIPPPPMGAKGKSQTRLGVRNQAQSKRTPLKPYHWLKFTRVMRGSLWEEAQQPEEASKAPQFDLSELETLFSAAVPKPEEGAGKSRRAAGPKSDKVQLIDLRRAYNCEIMLTKVKIPLPDLMSSVLALDDSALDIDQVDNLIKFCPTKEEMELLKNYKGEKDNLGKCEQFFLELMKVPRVESKLRVFSFKIQFCSQVSDLRNSLNIVNNTAEEVRNSVKLKRILQTILSLGNALNHGTARGSAVGFRLDSLLKLTDTRARNNKMTLIHYLCKVLAEKLPEVMDFPNDLGSLESAAKIQLKYLAEEMQAVNKGLEKIQQELTASESDGLVSESFCSTLKDFLGYAEGEVRSLATLYSGVGRNADALASYFGEDPARCPFEQVVSTLVNFVRMFKTAHTENCKQIEFERKKVEKEAENEKAKLNKELGNEKMKMRDSMGNEQLVQTG